MLFVVVLYEPQGYFCMQTIYDQRMANLGVWSSADIPLLRAQVDLTDSTTNIMLDWSETSNRKYIISVFVSLFSIIVFTALGANKALKLRSRRVRRDYFLIAVSF